MVTPDVNVLKVIHIHHGLRKIFIILVWNDQQSFYFCIIIFPVLFVYVKFQSIASLLSHQYSLCINLMTLNYTLLLHIKSSHLNLEVIVNVNRYLNTHYLTIHYVIRYIHVLYVDGAIVPLLGYQI